MSQYFSIHPVNPQMRLIKRAVEMIKQGGQDDSPVPGIEYRFPELNKI